MPEISGIDKNLCQQFSKRHEEIKNADNLRAGIKERMPGLSGIEIDNLVQLHSKSAKDKHLSGEELNRTFQTQLRGLGTSSADIIASTKLAGAERIQTEISARDFVRMASKDLAEQESVTDQKKIMAMAVKLATGSYVKSDLQQAFREVVKCGDIVDLGKGGYSTPEIQRIEHKVARMAVEQAHIFQPLMDKAGAQAAITDFEAAKGFQATKGQTAAIEYVLTGTGRLMVSCLFRLY